jgi:hypothetical protein
MTPVQAMNGMKRKNAQRFDLDAVRSRAGDTVFSRGASYHRSGSVTILSIEPNRVLARVAGTGDYRTVLTGRGTKIGGECSCPAFDEWGFCKHMVAAALAANDAGGGGDASEAGALTRIRRHLQKQKVDALIAMILDLAERDVDLFRTLELAAAIDDADDATLEARLRKAIDDAAHTSGYIEYREAGGWAAGVGAVLDRIEALPDARAGIQMRLAEHAADRIEGAIEGIDDSDSHGHALLERCAEIHCESARKARPDPVALARDLFEREMEGGYDTFYSAVGAYSDILGDTGLAEYRRLAEAAWAKLPVRTANPRSRDAAAVDYGTLISILDFFAARDDDLAARIALRRKDLSSAWTYKQLAQFCAEHGRDADALRYAEEGLWLFDGDRPDRQLLSLTASLPREVAAPGGRGETLVARV